MPSKIIKELLNGGIVQTRHPLMLKPGEVQTAANCILRPADTSLHRAPGRAAYGTVKSTNYTTTTNATTTLTLTSGTWATVIASVVVTANSNVITKASAFGTVTGDDSDTIKRGMSVYIPAGATIPAGTVVKRVVDSSTIELSNAATAGGTVSVVFSDLHPSTWITGDQIPVDTTVVSVASATTLIMSAAATTNNTPTARALSEAVSGLAVATFDHGNKDLLLAKAADKIHYSQLTGITGSFTELMNGLSQNSEAILGTVQFDNKHAVMTGYDPPRVVYYSDSGSGKTVFARTMGMEPVKEFQGPSIVSGTWSGLTDMGAGYYYFIVTEVAKFTDGTELEGTYSGKIEKMWVQVSNIATEAVQVTYGLTTNQPANDGHYGRNTATHWRIYMSPKQASQLPLPDLSAFVRVAEVPIGINSVTLKDASPYQSGYASDIAADGANLSLFPGGSTNVLSTVDVQTVTCTLTGDGYTLTATSGNFSTVTPGMVITSTNNHIPYGTEVRSVESTTSLTMSKPASASVTGEVVGFGNKNTFDNQISSCPVNTDSTRRGGVFSNFGLQNIGAFSGSTITGIKLEIKAAFISGGSDTGFLVEVSPDAGANYSSTGNVAAFKRGRVLPETAIVTLGGELDLWGMTGWSSADFANGGDFRVRLRKIYGGDGEEWTHLFDGVRVTVYAGTNTINLDGEPFRTVTISDQLGNTFGSPARGAPPIANTGDIFEGQVILNDSTDESVICGSLPGEYESFPDVYRIPIESRDNDKVRVIRRLNNTCIIGCLNSIKRLNYFPRETDPEFNRGRAYEDITLDHGIVGPRAAELVEIQGAGTVLAYLSHTGLRATDGVTTRILNDDIDWEDLIETDYIHQTVLRAYPKLFLLALYYVPPGSSRKVRVMYFSYHPTHLKPGNRLPAVGPVTVEVASADNPLIVGVPYLFTGHHQDGKVYVEDQGEDNAIEQSIKTRRFFTSELGREAVISREFVFVDANGTTNATFTGTGDFSAQLHRQNQGEALTSITAQGMTTATGGIVELFDENVGETFEWTLFKSVSGGQTASMRVHFFGFEVTGAHTDTNN